MMARAAGLFALLFPLWALLLSAWAVLQPELFSPLRSAIVPLLALVMFAMGLTLTPQSFTRVLRRPGTVALGVALQYGIMPFAGWLLATLAGASPEVSAGLVLLGACPGGTASNVVCYLARGDVALSITLTACSTLLAVLATPLLTWIYIGQKVPVPLASMVLSVLQIVLLPVAGGVVLNHLLGARLRWVERVAPPVSVAAIVVIIAIVVALNRDRMVSMAGTLLVLVVLHNSIGLAGGYSAGRLCGLDRRLCRTLAIEVGMQNSGLAAALAGKYFGALAALPGALFSVWHNLSGSALAAWWSRQAAAPQDYSSPPVSS